MKSQDKTNLLRQILVPGIIDYNNLFIEAAESTVQNIATEKLIVNDEETVIMKISDICSIHVTPADSYCAGESKKIIVTLRNKFRYSFTYETGNAIRLLWKRHMKNHRAGFSFEDDNRIR